MTKLTEGELKNLQTTGYYDWDFPRLPFAQLDKLFNEVPVEEITNFPGHMDNSEGKKILRVSEADIIALVEEAQAAGKGFLKEGVTITDNIRDMVGQLALGCLALRCDQPGGAGTPRRYYISEAKLIECLDALDPKLVKKIEGYGEPSLAPHQLQALIAEAELVNAPPLGKAYRITEQQLSQHTSSVRPRYLRWGSVGQNSEYGLEVEAKLGELLGGVDGEKGSRRYYVTKAVYDRYVANQPPTHGEIYELQKMRDTGVSGGSPSPGFKEFTASKLKQVLGDDWQQRLAGYWEKAPGTGHEDVAAVNMEALSARMQREKDEARTRRGSGFGRY